MKIEVPAGVDHGSLLRKTGYGHCNKSGEDPGDLLIKVSLLPDHFYKRKGADLYIDMPLELKEVKE